MTTRQNLIYDVGMNNGDDTAYYLFKGYHVVAIEADPTLVELAKERFKAELQQGKLTLLNVGITAEEGYADFWINEVTSEWNSFDRKVASRDNSLHHSIRIPCMRFDQVLKEHGLPYYLKVDIEGNDWLCLNALSKDALPEHVSVEMGDLELILKLRDLGYTQFKIIDQFTLLPLAYPVDQGYRNYLLAGQLYESRSIPARAVRKVVGWKRVYEYTQKSRQKGGWTFPMGSSGPFAQDLPGQWQSWEDTAFSWLYHLRRHKADRSNKDYTFWCDLHAFKPV